MKRIAIQGIKGSYHDIAAHKFFEGEDIELICCATFEQVFEELRHDSSVIGMAAIENTIAGSLLHNYELLRESGATIVGEHKQRISHSIMCLPEDNWLLAAVIWKKIRRTVWMKKRHILPCRTCRKMGCFRCIITWVDMSTVRAFREQVEVSMI